jgi:hypothetical protein
LADKADISIDSIGLLHGDSDMPAQGSGLLSLDSKLAFVK